MKFSFATPHNKTSTSPQPLDLGTFSLIPHRDRGSVEIPALRSDKPITCGVEDFLKAGAFFLSTPIVRERCPHAAIPLVEVENPSWIMTGTYRAALDVFGQGYAERFGSPDHDGIDSLFPPRAANTSTATWGNGAMILKVDRKNSTITLQGLSEVSVELMADIFITVLRDPHTAANFPNYSATYLRRWGENAFNVTRLKDGIPSALHKEIRIPHSSGLTLTTSESPSVSQIQSLHPVDVKLVMPPLTTSTAPKRGRPSGRTINSSDIARREREVEAKESLVEERECAIAAREASLIVAQEQIENDRLLLTNMREEIELEKQIAAEQSERATRLLAQADATLHAAHAEHEKARAVREEISRMLQAEVIDGKET
jgi:hypothetical protein